MSSVNTLPSGSSEKTETRPRRWTMQRVTMIAGGGALAVVLILFIAGLIFALTNAAAAKEFFGVMRDLFIIILAFQGILITVALVILVLQVAGLMTMLQTEIKPLLLNLQDTLNTARGSAQFVGENLATPLIKAGGFFAGTSVFLREFGGLRRAIRRNPDGKEIVADES